MSSIMRARSALTGRFEDWEVIGGSSLKPKVAGPSMLGIGCPNRHAFLFTRSPPPPKTHRPRRRPPARAGSFSGPFPDLGGNPLKRLSRVETGRFPAVFQMAAHAPK